MIKKCSRKNLADNIRRTRQMRSDVPKDLRPLFNHLIRLALDSSKHGYCTRSGRELKHARNLTKYSKG